MKKIIGNSWDEILKQEFSSEYYSNLREFLKNEYATQTIYPEMENIFNAFKLTPYENVRAVILGQDPYHEKGQAQGLCFSVPDNFPMPPSLINIFKELNQDLNIPIPKSGNLTKWAQQGVLLINSVLTVREGLANSHKDKGWEKFTDSVIKKLNENKQPIVFILWGAFAQKKAVFITNPQHLILKSSHPSPLSAYNGFFGSRPFSKTNRFLKNFGVSIDFNLNN